MIYPFNLQIFADGGAGDGSAGVGAGASGGNPQAAAAGTGANRMDAASNRSQGRNSLAGVQYGRQQTQKQPQGQDDAAGWQEAKTRYKSQYDAEMQQIVQARVKDSKGHQQAMETLTPMLNAMAKQWGIKEGDYQALADKFLDDDRLYEDEAAQTGMTVDAVKQLHRMKAELEKANAQVSQFTEQAQMQQHFRNLVQQGEELKAKYPLFDMQSAMQDERFVRMTSPNGGLSVEQAWAALHHDEMQAWAVQNAAMQAAQQGRMQAAQAVQANMARPRENAGRGMSPQAQVREDPRTFTAKDFRENARRANAGAKIAY